MPLTVLEQEAKGDGNTSGPVVLLKHTCELEELLETCVFFGKEDSTALCLGLLLEPMISTLTRPFLLKMK